MKHVTIPVDSIKIGDRARKDMGDVDALSGSIRDVGLLQPIVVNTEHRLIAGRRRLAAVESLGWKEVDVLVVKTLDDALQALHAERDENVHRKEFTPEEAAIIGKRIEEMEKAAAKERQKEGGKAGGKASGILPEASKGETRDKVAAAVGMSGRTYEKAKAVVEARDAEPEKFQPLVDQMNKTGKVDPAYKELKKQRPSTKKPGKKKTTIKGLAKDVQDLVDAGKLNEIVADRLVALKPSKKEQSKLANNGGPEAITQLVCEKDVLSDCESLVKSLASRKLCPYYRRKWNIESASAGCRDKILASLKAARAHLDNLISQVERTAAESAA